MAAISPFLGSSPSAIPPVSSLPLPQFSSPPQPSTPPEPSTPPPLPTRSTQADQTDANPPDPSSPSPPSSPPIAPSARDSGTPVISAPVDSTPPPTTTSAPPPSLPVFPPPSDPSPPPSPDVSLSPPLTNPPVSSPPPLSPPNPPTILPPSPPLATPPTSSPSPPTPSSSPPPTSPPSPPSSNPPPTPSSSDAPVVSPSPPWFKPPENSPPSPTSDAPQSSPSPPASGPPSTSPPGNSPPSGYKSASTPSIPATPAAPVSHDSPPSYLGPPVPGSQIMIPSSNRVPAHDSSFNSPQTAKGSNGGIGSGGAAAIGVVVGVLMFGLISLMALWIIKRKKRKSGTNDAYVMPASLGSSPRSDTKLVVKTEYPSPPFRGGYSSDAPTDHGGFGNTKPWFTYHELLEATDGFSGQNLLGEGGFGYVYKGVLADGREVAVKQLKVGGGQGEREFQAEVEIISRIHHRHLVSLVGYCILESKRLLVYEYVQNDTLYFHLHGKGRPTMDWATRVKIAIGAARGIAYLHEDCHPRVIHRDIKSSNILLDNNFEARVADFGLARLAMDADTHVSTRVMGTFGYLAPEYATSGKLSEKSDVYSFGVVLLELITGRKPVDESQPLGDESVVEWARPLLPHVLETGDFACLVDPRLEKNYIESEMFQMIEAAAACVRHSSSKRPRMGQVVRALDGISDSGDLSNGLRVGESRMYNSAQQSAEIRWFRRVAFGSQDISSDFFDQNSVYSHQSGPNVNFSAQQGQNGNFSRQHSETSQNLDFSRQSRQNANFSAGGIPRPPQSNVNF